MTDFTYNVYEHLLKSLLEFEYDIISFEESIKIPKPRSVILRHDVDYLPNNALRKAIIEHNFGIRATYFFRIVPYVFDPEIILKIAGLGHEIGYHYEDMDLVHSDSLEEHIDLAYESFCANLIKIRKVVPVSTICMHGSPRSKYDNKMIWTKYDYKKLELIGEPYFDIDFNDVFYVTDTGRKWNKSSVSVRDKVLTNFSIPIKSTNHFIQQLQNNKLPDKIIVNTHPHRWFDPGIRWYRELILQNVKNVAKYYLIKLRNDKN
jgi:hypothetical protein